MKTKRKAISAELTGTSNRNPKLSKYDVTYIDVDGTEKHTYAYGEDMEEALSRVRRNIRNKDMERMIKKNAMLINIVAVLSTITLISVLALIFKVA